MKNYKGMGLLKSNRLKKSYQNDLSGFTLAEVLITLGIIGVVAAMVIPTLISNIQGAVFRSKFKKAVATLGQAAKLNKARYDWDFASLDTQRQRPMTNDNPETRRTKFALFNGSLSGHTSFTVAPDYVLTFDSNTGNSHDHNKRHLATNGMNVQYFGSSAYAVQTQDGMLFAFSSVADSSCHKEPYQTIPEFLDSGQIYITTTCLGYIDVNGEAGPNRETVCEGTPKASGKYSGKNDIGWTVLDPSVPCKVTSKTIGDQFPVLFHDDVVEPASNAAAAVLGSAK